jgi:non-ribosomal peptide synthetase component E (peptide arylation enzyme)
MPASHFDVKAMTGRPKFIVRHSTYAIFFKSSVHFCSMKKHTLTFCLCKSDLRVPNVTVIVR